MPVCMPSIMYVCMYVCMHVCTYACMHACIRDPQKHITISILWGYPYLIGASLYGVYLGYPYPNFCLCAFLRPYVCMYVCMYVYVYVCRHALHVTVYVRMDACMRGWTDGRREGWMMDGYVPNPHKTKAKKARARAGNDPPSLVFEDAVSWPDNRPSSMLLSDYPMTFDTAGSMTDHRVVHMSEYIGRNC